MACWQLFCNSDCVRGLSYGPLKSSSAVRIEGERERDKVIVCKDAKFVPKVWHTDGLQCDFFAPACSVQRYHRMTLQIPQICYSLRARAGHGLGVIGRFSHRGYGNELVLRPPPSWPVPKSADADRERARELQTRIHTEVESVEDLQEACLG